ncbi:hypothetical protein [Serratia plymuthica]|uniref:hypothetical protein n=1 Tax=Serratia plymuthica TaxID=82996 RepID=UPI0021B6FC60|nr:hypothetical protein [Serratia plymuthica]
MSIRVNFFDNHHVRSDKRYLCRIAMGHIAPPRNTSGYDGYVSRGKYSRLIKTPRRYSSEQTFSSFSFPRHQRQKALKSGGPISAGHRLIQDNSLPTYGQAAAQ